MATSAKRIPISGAVSSPYFLAGKFAASCALALLAAMALGIPDLVTAAFVAILCCSPGALMGLRTSFEQFAGSVVGGSFGTLAAIVAPQAVGVPSAVGLAVLCTHLIGFSRGAIAAAFTALFVQIVTFGDPLHTFGYRLAAVGIAAMSAFVVNVAISAFFYESLFRKRIQRVSVRVEALVRVAATGGPSAMFPAFASINQVTEELDQALRELSWRRNEATAEVLQGMRSELLWLRDYVHLIVNLEMGETTAPQEVLTFIAWLAAPQGEMPPLLGERSSTRTRLAQMIAARVRGSAGELGLGESPPSESPNA